MLDTTNPRRSGLNPKHLVAAAAGLAALATLLITLLPFASFAYRSQGAHVAIETAASLIATLAAVIVIGRFARSHQRSDLLLSAAMILFATSNIVFSAIPSLSYNDVGAFEIWSPLAGRALGAAVLLAAALLPDRRVRRPRRALMRAFALTVGGLAAVAALCALLGPVLPSGIDRELSPESSGRPRIVGHPALLTAYIVVMVIYAVAALGFTRRAERSRDELLAWFAAGTAVAAFSRLNYFLFPSLYSEWVYTGDILRLTFYLLLFAGAAREIAAYQGQLATAAVLEERRRMARDLHDGLAQELAFISSQTKRLAGTSKEDVAEMVVQAADRALDESRAVIATLTRPVDAGLSETLASTVNDLAMRSGAEVNLDLDAEATATPAVSESLARIAGEAVNNAIRHGKAQRLWVELHQADDLRLVIRDDGSGFDAAAVDGGGFGLRSMRERAEALGGALRVTSAPGEGAEIEVRVP